MLGEGLEGERLGKEIRRVVRGGHVLDAEHLIEEVLAHLEVTPINVARPVVRLAIPTQFDGARVVRAEVRVLSSLCEQPISLRRPRKYLISS